MAERRVCGKGISVLRSILVRPTRCPLLERKIIPEKQARLVRSLARSAFDVNKTSDDGPLKLTISSLFTKTTHDRQVQSSHCNHNEKHLVIHSILPWPSTNEADRIQLRSLSGTITLPLMAAHVAAFIFTTKARKVL
jgi:hypothetical protein